MKDNDGRSLRKAIKAARTELWTRFGAYSKGGLVESLFLMSDGSHAVDVSEEYFLFLEEARIEELEQILRKFKEGTLQEKISLEIHHDVELRLI